MPDDIAKESRFDRGWRTLAKLDDEIGDAMLANLREVAPDFGRLAVEFAFGDIYSRPGLALAEREIASISALTVLGNASSQLKVHIRAALNVGLTKTQVAEIIVQMAVYAGFPAALNALSVAKEVFDGQ